MWTSICISFMWFMYIYIGFIHINNQSLRRPGRKNSHSFCRILEKTDLRVKLIWSILYFSDPVVNLRRMMSKMSSFPSCVFLLSDLASEWRKKRSNGFFENYRVLGCQMCICVYDEEGNIKRENGTQIRTRRKAHEMNIWLCH